MAKPRILDNKMFLCLRTDDIEAFNTIREVSEELDLSGTDLSRVDLRGLNADKINFEDTYFRKADLRGIDFRKANLQGASFGNANISGCYFPDELRADEILFSLVHGTRVRYNR